MIEYDLRPGGRLRIELEGQDVFRFAVNMLGHQTEFFEAARVILIELREMYRAEHFDPMARSLLGKERYEKLSPYFLRDTHCIACEVELEPTDLRRNLPGGHVVCESCGLNDMTAVTS